jgi:3-oxoadipate enol-lactonase/4-carboxymuconolactone decarboxylase
MHVRAARTNGLTNDEIKELLLQTAIYCGVPDANAAFRIAQQVLAELDQPAQPPEASAPPTSPATTEEQP